MTWYEWVLLLYLSIGMACSIAMCVMLCLEARNRSYWAGDPGEDAVLTLAIIILWFPLAIVGFGEWLGRQLVKRLETRYN